MTTDLTTLVTYNPPSLLSREPLTDAWTAILQMDLDATAVCDEQRRVVGIACSEDICRTAMELGVADTVSLDGCVSQAPVRGNAAWPAEILELLLANDLPIIPIVDDSKGHLLGVVGRTDYLRELSFNELPTANIPLADLVHRFDDWFQTDMDLDEAYVELEKHPQRVLPVGNGDMLLGVVSPKALTRAWASWHFKRLVGFDPTGEPTALGLLARIAPAAPAGASLADAAALMIEHNVDAITVGDATRRILGYVTATDLLQSVRHSM